MNLKTNMIILTIMLTALWQLPAQTSSVATGDSMALQDVIQKVLASHPSIKQAEEASKIADAKIQLAQSAYLPDVDITASYARIGPVSSFDMPNLGTIQFYPENNYAASLNYRQTLYDFGKTGKNVSLEQENKNLTSQNLDLARQKLALATVNSFYTLVYFQDAIRIKDEEIKNLEDHLAFMVKKQTTGSATSYEILLTRVRLTTTLTQKTDLETARNTQLAVFNSMMGNAPETQINLRKGEAPVLPSIQKDSLLGYAYNHRMELALSREKETLAGLQYKLMKAQNNPVLSLQGYIGEKNGYLIDINELRTNFSVGLGLKIPIFDANRLKRNLTIQQSNITNVSLDTEIARRNIGNEVIENEANVNASLKKINQFEMSALQANEAYKLAKTSYEAGVITNLELLDAETQLSDSNLKLLKSKIDYILSLYRLKTSLGDQLY